MAYTDNPTAEVAAERDRILWIIGRWQSSPSAHGISSKAYTAINNGLTPEQILAKNWGHPWVNP